MSGFSPRDSEIQAVVDLLESDQFASGEQLARAIVTAVAKRIARRELYLLLPPDGALAWGPYWTESEVRKAWETEVGPATGGQARFFRSYPFSPFEQAVDDSGACTCGHAKEQHVVKNLRGGKLSAPGECGVCPANGRKGTPNPCKNYERAS